MAKLVLLITPLIERGHDIGEAWTDAGAPAVTYFESHGLHTLKQRGKAMQILPGMMSLTEIMRHNDHPSLTLLSIVEDKSAVDAIIPATEAIIGPLMDEGNGILFVLDVEQAVGLRDYNSEASVHSG